MLFIAINPEVCHCCMGFKILRRDWTRKCVPAESGGKAVPELLSLQSPDGCHRRNVLTVTPTLTD